MRSRDLVERGKDGIELQVARSGQLLLSCDAYDFGDNPQLTYRQVDEIRFALVLGFTVRCTGKQIHLEQETRILHRCEQCRFVRLGWIERKQTPIWVIDLQRMSWKAWNHVGMVTNQQTTWINGLIWREGKEEEERQKRRERERERERETLGTWEQGMLQSTRQS